MCGRYSMHHEADELIERFQLAEIQDQFEGSFNFAPSQQVPVVTQQDSQRVLETMRWGLVPSWAKDIKIGYKMINARCEGI
ncbi:MAG: SOS response-associated peptidase family protein, partial [Abditibacteriaceae bacterium]